MSKFMYVNLEEIIELDRERVRSFRRKHRSDEFVQELPPVAFKEMTKAELAESIDPYKQHLQVFPESSMVGHRIQRLIRKLLEVQYLEFTGVVEYWAHLAPATYREAMHKSGEIRPDTVMLKVYYEERDAVKLVAKY